MRTTNYIAPLVCIILLWSATLVFALDKNDRGRLEWWRGDPSLSVIFYGKQHSIRDDEILASCPWRPDLAIGTNDEAGLKLGAAGVSAEASLKMEKTATEISGKTASVQEILDLEGINCFLYWSNGQEESSYLRTKVILQRARDKLAIDESESPAIFIVDSPIHVYSSGVTSDGSTNADVIRDELIQTRTNARILTANASPQWSRTSDVLEAKPELVIVHFSAFEGGPLTPCSPTAGFENFCIAQLMNFVSDVVRNGSKAIVYTRTPTACDPRSVSHLRDLLETLELSSEEMSGITIVQMAGDMSKAKTSEENWSTLADISIKILSGSPATSATENIAVCSFGA